MDFGVTAQSKASISTPASFALKSASANSMSFPIWHKSTYFLHLNHKKNIAVEAPLLCRNKLVYMFYPARRRRVGKKGDSVLFKGHACDLEKGLLPQSST